jgi:NADH-quinone oxidoreductase subunit B
VGIETRLPSFITTKLDWILNRARASAVWPLPFATACCGIEFMASASSRYDLSRFGSEIMRFSPRQADLFVVAGRVCLKEVPVMLKVYRQMAEPKWVMALGACASTGGMLDVYGVVQGIDRYLPVDVYVPGCPPRPEAIIDGFMEIHKIIKEDRISDKKYGE